MSAISFSIILNGHLSKYAFNFFWDRRVISSIERTSFRFLNILEFLGDGCKNLGE